MVDGALVVALVTHHEAEEPAPSLLLEEARAHHVSERNPFTYLERHRMLDQAIRETLGSEAHARVRLIPLPRPELCWPYVERVFPEERVWIVPDVGEELDDLKASFFRSRGDQVLRIPLNPTVSGYEVRQRIQRKEALDGLVPAAVAGFIDNWRKA